MGAKDREQPIIVVKKKVGGHGHHGGAWKVAFADFMTAMFALFLVLWLVNQSSDVKSAIAGYFQDPLGRADEFGSSIVPGEGAQTQMARPLAPAQLIDIRIDRMLRLAEVIKEKLGRTPLLDSLKNHVEITLTEEGLRIELLEDSTAQFFQSGSAQVSDRGRQLLALIGRELAADSNQIQLEGHTDARPYTSAAGYTNWELSADRANTARRILGENGVPPQRVDQIRGLADRKLRYPEAPYDPRNRRVTILVLLDRYLNGTEVPADSVRKRLEEKQ
ncbi:MAG: flagellar motor protein MotB [Gemmatimonadales bacterium]|nr:flagellar motor protein MotB [Gemmatimonadales bacterium]